MSTERSVLTIEAPTEQNARILSFDDNRLLGELVGALDQNLAIIEQKLGVSVAARGNKLHISGARAHCVKAELVLRALYQRLASGGSVGFGDVEGIIRLSDRQNLEPDMLVESAEGRLPEAAQIVTRKRTVTARSAAQNAYLRALDQAALVFSAGPAGTGKTYLAVAYGASLLERGLVERLIFSRPAVEAGERLGFLPGDMREKVDPYLRPLYDALYDVMAADKVERGLQAGQIEIAPLAFMRGRTLTNAAVILDEAQNCSVMQMKMFLTRLGENTRMIVTGDPTQIDLPTGQKSGLLHAMDILSHVKGIAHIRFTDVDVVRHELVGRIIRAYDNVTSGSKKSRN